MKAENFCHREIFPRSFSPVNLASLYEVSLQFSLHAEVCTSLSNELLT